MLKFKPASSDLFYKDLRKRVNLYFKENNKSIHANKYMVIKTISLFLLFFGPYFAILLVSMPVWAMWSLTVLMGLSVAGIGMSIMHDACHGAYSGNKTINKLLGYSLNLVGGNRFNWILQHNVKHHTYPNVYGEDDDIDNNGVIRLSPFSKRYWFHRYQHIYAWFIYTLATVSWVTLKDFRQFYNYYKDGMFSKEELKKELPILIISKILFYGYIMLIPYLVLNLPFWMILVGFATLHMVAGFTLTVTFQLAHVVENTYHENNQDKIALEDSWATHQLKTTSDFSRRNKFLNWYLGGLNFQVEHHLFPHICHVHYKPLSQIVEATAKDHDLPFYQQTTLGKAIKSHYMMLKTLGQQEEKELEAV